MRHAILAQGLMALAFLAGSVTVPAKQLTRSVATLPARESSKKATMNQFEPQQYNVIWTSASLDSSGSMPLGSGEFGANVWATDSGSNIHLMLSRNDSWSEICRLLKLGQLNIHLDPNPFENDYRQTLHLEKGSIEFSGSGGTLTVFFQPKSSLLYITGKFKKPVLVSASLSTWRTSPHQISTGEMVSAWTMKDAPFPLIESADHTSTANDAVTVMHENLTSIVDFTLKHQGIDQLKDDIQDPLLHRVFGTTLKMVSPKGTAAGIVRQNSADATVTGVQPTRTLNLIVASGSDCPSTQDQMKARLSKLIASAPSPAAALHASDRFWQHRWQDSFIAVTSDDPNQADIDHKVTQAYALQRFMMLCASFGEYPFKYNGSIFNIAPEKLGQDYNPDWRRWGDGYWWQNMRLPYWAMVSTGDFDAMESLFKLYERVAKLGTDRTKIYYGANVEGNYIPETISCFGSYSNSDYGWDRSKLTSLEPDSPWWKHAWNQTLELVRLMLDRYEAGPKSGTARQHFLTEQLIPTAISAIQFFDTKFPRDPNGQIRLTPDQAVETYWKGVENDTPCIAGLHSVLPELINLPGVPEKELNRWKKVLKELPPIAVTDGKVLPAEKYDPDRSNVENPEFYAIWPFRQFGTDEGNAEIASKTYDMRIEKANYGWQYDGQVAALAGNLQASWQSLLSKVASSNPHYRFPAMWGPNYDWLPDQCHGGNLMLTLQSITLQALKHPELRSQLPAGMKIHFRLYRPNGPIEGSI